jgi:nicotinate-nucleotide adenylyltransferase
MALSATAGHPFFAVSRMERERPAPSYTIDTIHRLRKICPAEAEIFFITGADALLDILSWKDAESLLKSCRFIAVPRFRNDQSNVRAHIKRLQTEYGASVDVLDTETPAVSGTQIRNRLKNKESIRYLLPLAAEDYIYRHGLYQFKAPSFKECKQRISAVLSPRRYAHTLGTVEESEKLAVCYGADREKARWAALLHDCAKEYSPDKKRTLCALWNVPMDDILSNRIDLTHSLLGAESAMRNYQLYDEEILQAIRYHTTGHANMTLLDKIILLADFIEPRRDDYPGLSEMRALAYKDINKALLVGFKEVAIILEKNGQVIHPWNTAAIKQLEADKNEQ